ncbi:DEAD/DEAH box helicase domain protein [Desulfosporosinus sp. I2]|uniref:DEAD/DEAH box helicase n=1 Tax=Desulfosporosinus sp. I2 TaxID=1617025 RepID=UPI0005EF8F29|nr:DEAD/DEAH box helicase [Desulfosporosinus sp. I2]KJR46471.1 DEAD/DEAH box helicase domain protein [Desulfosporosinus sp. I2]
MLPNDIERLEVANEIRSSLANKDILTPVQARSFVRCLQTTWEVPTIRWGDNESLRQLDDARRLIHSAGIFRQIEGGSSTNALLCYRRAAELLEWLVRSNDLLRSTVPIELFAAGAYQLGGLPAMASSLLAQAEFRDNGSQLYASFLRADFDGVIRSVTAFWKVHPELRDHNATGRLLVDKDGDNISWYITVELVRSVGLIADSLRRGDDQRLERALAKLDALDRLTVRTFSDDTSMLIALLCGAAKEFRESSIYRPIFQLAQFSPSHRDRLYTFARGQFSRRRGILWSSQRQGLTKLLHESSFALCTPTGSGKTLVANLALVKELLLWEGEGPAPLALYIVPSRALAGEVEAKLSSELGEDLIITGLYGGTDWGVTDYWMTADRPTVLIATVEKADALMRFIGPVLALRLRLLIIDEAHQVVPEDSKNTLNAFADHTNRSIKLESLVSRLLMQSPTIARIALTAVAGGASSPVAKWIVGRDDAEAVETSDRSTRQLVGMLEASSTSGRILLDLMNGQPLAVLGRVEPVYIPLGAPVMPQLPPSMRNSIYCFTQLHVLWTALHLVNDNRRILISVVQQPEQTMGWYKKALEQDEWQDIVLFELPQEEGRLARFMETRAVCIDYCGTDSNEVFLLDRGIASNHGQMPQRLRRLMTSLIDSRICPITVATSTLTEGVNLPFDLIFLTSLKRRSFDPATGRVINSRLNISEFNNLAGRAGRPGYTKGMEGMTLVAVPQRPSSTAPVTIQTQQGQIREMQRDYANLMSELQVQEIEREDVSSPLALLMKAIAERVRDVFGFEGEDFLDWLEATTPVEISEDAGTGQGSDDARFADSVDELDSILLNALEEVSRVETRALDGADAEVFLTAVWQRTFTHVAAVQESWLEQAFIRRGRAVIEVIYPDADERKRLYQYGFSPCIGRRFERVVPDIRLRIGTAVAYGTMSTSERLAIFKSLGDIVSADRGFGFRVRATETDQNLLSNWPNVLTWWMKGEDVQGPVPSKLRFWQRFVVENLEFRLGVAIGAVVAYAWSEGAVDPSGVPSLVAWRETTGLPWFGFWVRELLRWGTLDPFVAFVLAQGMAHTRSEAAERRPEFEAWLISSYEAPEADDLIDPRLFLEWQRGLEQRAGLEAVYGPIEAELAGTTGQRGCYNVIPVKDESNVSWIDASGYELARSKVQTGQLGNREFRDDFELHVENGAVIVQQTSVEY